MQAGAVVRIMGSWVHPPALNANRPRSRGSALMQRLEEGDAVHTSSRATSTFGRCANLGRDDGFLDGYWPSSLG